MKIVCNGETQVDRILSVVAEAEVVVVHSSEEVLTAAADAEVVIGIGSDKFSELLRNNAKLRWVHTATAGVDRFICDELRSSTAVLTCAKDGPAGPNLADHAMALLLSLSRNIHQSARSTTWRRHDLSQGVLELGGKTAGIAGYGAAGREIARRAAAFGMSVAATKLKPPHDSRDGVTVLPPDHLTTMLEQSDVVFNTLPGTAATHGLFDERIFGFFKEGSLLINVGRGSTVNTADLVRALESGALAGAGLDVVDPEPLPDGHPLWTMDNVIITPHIAGVADERSERNMQLILENLRRLVAGQPLRSVVDPVAGY
jgi:phosphoglycerate dehydrogenase-like enzyme